MHTKYLRWLCGLLWLLLPAAACALEPKDIFIIANKNVPESRQVAEHYCQKRDVPKENILVFDLPKGEDISREDYNRLLRDPLRAALKKHREQAKVLLTVYGVPLRVGASQPTKEDKEQLKKVRELLTQWQDNVKQLQKEIAGLETANKEKPDDAAEKLKQLRQQQNAFSAKVKALQQQQKWLNHGESRASVDSELMLLWWDDYELRRWQPNLLNFRVPDKVRQSRPKVLMASRLDGPSVEIAKRLVDDAVEVEKTGLKGKVYVDARGIGWNKKQDRAGSGYGGYDESLREMAKLLQEQAKMDVVLDNKPALFKPQSCPDAALYCGWYSLANYVDCCDFVKGAVAYHIASAEAVSLRNPKAKYWCPNLLKAGVCATMGPVAEPYTIGFPKPAEFFGFLVTGEYTLVECYAKTQLLNSWMTVLVGDPLYNPFKNNPRLKAEQVQPSPEGSPFLFTFQFGPSKQ